MIFQRIKECSVIADTEFNALYSENIKNIAHQHFTPFRVAKMAAIYLAGNKETKVLDIGSGAGKFCLIGATCTDSFFVGIEQRKNLCEIAQNMALHYQIPNTNFIHANITDISLQNYDAFYLYNPFYENIWTIEKLDNQIELKRSLYFDYSEYVKQELDKLPIETKLATYYSFLAEIPDSYLLESSAFGGKLKFWKKVK